MMYWKVNIQTTLYGNLNEDYSIMDILKKNVQLVAIMNEEYLTIRFQYYWTLLMVTRKTSQTITSECYVTTVSS